MLALRFHAQRRRSLLRMCSTLCALSNVYMRSIMIGATFIYQLGKT